MYLTIVPVEYNVETLKHSCDRSIVGENSQETPKQQFIPSDRWKKEKKKRTRK